MQNIKNFAVYARMELEKHIPDASCAKSSYIAMIINRYADIHSMDICYDDSLIPDYIKQKFSADIPSADIFDVENLTWLYQYFVNTDRKNAIDTIGGLETDSCDVSAATQVFTPKWIVQYMIDNSLGRYWADLHPDTAVTAILDYYIPHSSHHMVQSRQPSDITVFDPCCGCGNILIYAFDVLMLIYHEAGYDDAQAATCILEDNLYGADIDPHAASVAEFCLMAKAHAYCKDIFLSGKKPHIEVIADNQAGSLAYGISPTSVTSMQFDIVCTNPPYLSRMSKQLKAFAAEHFKKYSKDLFTAFMYRGLQYCNLGGYMAYMTPNVWMFLSSHKDIRSYILSDSHICTLAELEKGSYFAHASVDICAFVLHNAPSSSDSIYIRPNTGIHTMQSQQKAVIEAVHMLKVGKMPDYVYSCPHSHFDLAPDKLLVYWADAPTLRLFSHPRVGEVFTVKQGMTTGNNKRFLRYWWQVPYGDIGLNMGDLQQAAHSGKTWFPYNKGGKYRKWYGNNEYVVMYGNDGAEIKAYTSKLPQGSWVRIKSREYYFRQSITWSFISSSRFGARYSPLGSIFDVAGSSLFGDNLEYVLGLLGSKVAYYLLQLINPTMNYQIRDIKSLPYIHDRTVKDEVAALTQQCIDISAQDWDSRETSYRFCMSPLVEYCSGMQLSKAVEKYILRCTNSFDKIKAAETRLNEIFIKLYGLESVLTPEVAASDVTITIPDETTAVSDLISYCTGLCLGRFMPDGGINSIYAPASTTTDSLCRYIRDYIDTNFDGYDEEYISKVLSTDLETYIQKLFIRDHAKKYKNRPVYHQDGDIIRYDLGDICHDKIYNDNL